MAPEARAGAATIARLRLEIAADRKALAIHETDISEVLASWPRITTTPPVRGSVVIGAVAIHGWYTALEALCERALRICDGSVPLGDSWHRDPLFQAMAEIPDVRPALLPVAAQADLLALLGFRHFFRHAYAVVLDPGRIHEHLLRVQRLAVPLQQALDAFDQFLQAAASSLPSF